MVVAPKKEILSLTLTIDRHTVSLSQGGARELICDRPDEEAGFLYWFSGSASGTFPGVEIEVGTVPLNPDGYMTLVLSHAMASALKEPVGILDAEGRAVCPLVVKPGTNPDLAGLTLYHAYAILDPDTLYITAVSNAVPLTLLD